MLIKIADTEWVESSTVVGVEVDSNDNSNDHLVKIFLSLDVRVPLILKCTTSMEAVETASHITEIVNEANKL